MKRLARIALPLAIVLVGLTTWSRSEPQESPKLVLHARSRVLQKADNGADQFVPVEKELQWAPARTALVICDMWDTHWCQGAAERVTELAVPVNKFAQRARELGVLVIHAPSTCVEPYKDTPQRRLAQAAPFAKTPSPISDSTRWGTRWCWPDPKREPELPIDDSDMGCDCADKCEIRSPWTRQIDAIEIKEGDAISDDGQEVFNLLAARDIDNVLIVGVHLNMCVLGRSFAIRQMVKLGKNVVLIRDLTDTMYDHRRKPFVDHFSGTDLVVEHVEKFWCPTATSADLLGGEPFRFAQDARK
jgi:nicotinamidase-related amidase